MKHVSSLKSFKNFPFNNLHLLFCFVSLHLLSKLFIILSERCKFVLLTPKTFFVTSILHLKYYFCEKKPTIEVLFKTNDMNKPINQKN